MSSVISRYRETVEKTRTLISRTSDWLQAFEVQDQTEREALRALTQMKETTKSEGRRLLEMANKLWNENIRYWHEQQQSSLPVEAEPALDILHQWYFKVETEFDIRSSDLTLKLIPSLDILIQHAKSSPFIDSTGPPDYVIYECHCGNATIKDADPRAFMLYFSEALGVHSDSIISHEIAPSSLITKALLPYEISLKKVTDFNTSGNQQWKVTETYQFNAAADIQELVEEIKVNSYGLSNSQLDKKLNFLFTEPNASPIRIMITPIVDFSMVEYFVTRSIEKSILDIEIADIDLYGNESFMTQFQTLLKLDSNVKYLFHGTGQPEGFIGRR
jgi:hypothetical protein